MPGEEPEGGDCVICGIIHSVCPLLQGAIHVRDEIPLSRARLTLPRCLQLAENQGMTVVAAKELIKEGTIFGPFEAKKVRKFNPGMNVPFKVFGIRASWFLDTRDENTCNWMCLVSPAGDHCGQNLIAYQMSDSIYFLSIKDISEGEMLCVGYSAYYSRKMEKVLDPYLMKHFSGVFTAQLSVEAPVETNQIPVTSEVSTKEVVAESKVVPRKKGRPPKYSKQRSTQEHGEKHQVPSAKSNIDVRKEYWICSICGEEVMDEHDFATHLQGHYQPAYVLQQEQLNMRPVPSNKKSKRKSQLPNKDENQKRLKLDPTSVEMPENLGDQESTAGTQQEERTSGTYSEQKDSAMKEYQLVSHSQDGSDKCNLRMSRKTLVLSDDEMVTAEVPDSDEEDDPDADTADGMVSSSDATCPIIITVPFEASESSQVVVEETVYDESERQSSQSQEETVVSITHYMTDEMVSCDVNHVKDANSENISTTNPLPSTELPVPSHASTRQDLHIIETRIPEPSASGKYMCDLCGKQFNKAHNLYVHLEDHVKEFFCHRCQSSFSSAKSRDEHICPGVEKSFSCSKCSRKFVDQTMLDHHMIRKHSKSFSCTYCGNHYSTKALLKSHSCSSKTSSESKKIFQCNICTKKFSKQIYLLKHKPVHTALHTCSICGKRLRSERSLTNHLRICQQVEEIQMSGRAKCHICYEEFTEVSVYRKHQFEHTHMHVCEKCGARFRNKMKLEKHHCLGSPYPCTMCFEAFISAEELQKHKCLEAESESIKCTRCGKYLPHQEGVRHFCRKPHQPDQNNKTQSLSPLVCEICGSCFSSTSSLNVHRALHGEKKHSCPVCGKRFHRKDLMIEHQAVHGDPSFPCDVCNKLFKTKKSLDVHIMIHEGVKKYKCPLCDKAFYQKGNLQKHADTHKSGQIYVCRFCQKKFRTKDYLNLHLLEHTHGRLFTCEICNRSFVKHHQLNRHSKIFHGNRRYVCKYCGLSVKLRHSIIRHLKRKHAQLMSEWNNTEAVKAMLVPREEPAVQVAPADSLTEFELIQESEDGKGSEVVLGVARIEDEELQEAIESGRAKITQGPTPHTFEISMPLNNSPETPAVLIDTSIRGKANQHFEEPQSSTLRANRFQKTKQPIPGEKHQMQMPKALRSQEVLLEVKRMQQESADPQESAGKLTKEETHIDSTLADVVNEHIGQGVESVSTEEARADTSRVPEGSQEHVTRGESGQQIVIETEENAHHIVLDTSSVQVQQGNEQNPERTFILEDGTILQQGAGNGSSDLLFYILTTNEVE